MTEGVGQSARFIETLQHLLSRGHAVRFQADGWSMHPTIRFGEIIVIEPLGQRPVHAGDVLLYRRNHKAIAHRVIQVAASAGGSQVLSLRGDAADCCDSPIDLEQVLGRVVGVERRGRVVRFGWLSRTWSLIWARMLRRVRIARMKVAERIAL